MPLVINASPEAQRGEKFNENNLFNSQGKLTLEAEAVAQFLGTVDFSPLFEHPQVKPLVKSSDGKMSLAGSVVAAFVDEADLYGMFKHFIQNEYPDQTLEDKTVRGKFADMLEDNSYVAFKPPYAKPAPAQGINETRVRLMQEMLSKAVFSDGKITYPKIGKSMPENWCPPDKSEKFRSKPGVNKLAGVRENAEEIAKRLVAEQQAAAPAPKPTNESKIKLCEGASLAAGILTGMKKRSLVESTKK